MFSRTKQSDDVANRCRNIVSAIDNLLVQLGHGECCSNFYFRLNVAREVFEHEMIWHKSQSRLEREFDQKDLFNGNNSGHSH